MRVMPREWISNPETAVAFAEATGKRTTDADDQKLDLAVCKDTSITYHKMIWRRAPLGAV